MNIGFAHRDPQKSLDELRERLGEENRWFAELIIEIGRAMRFPHKITDIVIREGKPIKLAIVKAYFPYAFTYPREEGRVFVPTGEHIISLTSRICGISPQEVEHSNNLDFALAVYGLGVYRFNYSRDIMGRTLTIRHLDFDIPSLEAVGYPPHYVKTIAKLVERKTLVYGGRSLDLGVTRGGGLILHVGPTGSGKSTSIAAEIKYLADNISGTIITYEKPVEYRFLHTKAEVLQFDIMEHMKPNPAKGEEDEFDAIKNHLLRNNPSAILLGEVRTDKEITGMVDIASRGHVVFASMHARNVYEAMSLLLSKCRGYTHLLASALTVIVAHGLVLGREGRIIPVFEIFIPDRSLRKRIQDDDNPLEAVDRAFYVEGTLARHTGSFTFEQYIQNALESGRISADEAVQVRKAMEPAMRMAKV
ncbi:ATPase, T2SS/T4P/T4SS family [Thermosulfurimonas sp. F29]|uniref:ATPase, T2SS/T4P/T4SS family n=1 Tax=Thermosulfurimonas sp. F29 TaxID=2867247 RepID=UPI001C839336|nr:ATPase, T2SS/T4P/T4SS family [Thermosulfurimonas sp. F29]MBX6424103.1 Flp pilus assembly complex ATPase component TadA [Thermosulfurimonas sp. F29]